MTTAERIQAVIDHGFTEGEARFLVLVMLDSALCIRRQYGAFAGIANGSERCNACSPSSEARIRTGDPLPAQWEASGTDA